MYYVQIQIFKKQNEEQKQIKNCKDNFYSQTRLYYVDLPELNFFIKYDKDYWDSFGFANYQLDITD